jgi:hypothetical protein
MDRQVCLVLYILGRSIIFSLLREPIGYLLWVFFVIFLAFFLYVGKTMGYRENVENALSANVIFL